MSVCFPDEAGGRQGAALIWVGHSIARFGFPGLGGRMNRVGVWWVGVLGPLVSGPLFPAFARLTHAHDLVQGVQHAGSVVVPPGIQARNDVPCAVWVGCAPKVLCDVVA